jgi:hypothetical protein
VGYHDKVTYHQVLKAADSQTYKVNKTETNCSTFQAVSQDRMMLTLLELALRRPPHMALPSLILNPPRWPQGDPFSSVKAQLFYRRSRASNYR